MMTSLEGLVQAQVEETPTIVVPLTGQVLDLTKPLEIAGAPAGRPVR